jgi:hypothetical protein
MTIEVKCPNRSCDQQLALSPEMAGKKGKCPKCGKTFQIPQTLGSRGAPAAAQSARQQAPAQKPSDVMAAEELSAYLVDDDLFADEASPAPAPRRRPAPTAEVIDDYEADVVEEVYEEPRPVRRRRDDYEHYEAEPYEDEEDDVPHGSTKGGSGLSKTRRWMLGSVGFLILAIAMCVLGGSYVFLILSEAFIQLAGAASSMALGKAAATFLKISQIVWLLATIGVITGYSFCLFIPNKRATLGLTIAALSVCVLNLILGIIFRFVPAVRSDWVYTIMNMDFTSSRTVHAGWFGGGLDAGPEILSMFLELAIVAELMLLSLLQAEIARAQKDRHHKADCMRVVWFLTGLAGAIVVMYFFMFFVNGGSDKWMAYVVRIFNWACNGLLVLSMVFLIMNLFFTRKSTA